MYKLQERALEQALRHHGIDVEGKRVLDVGCGTGFFVDFYAQKKAVVTGIDIADISVRMLGAKFPSCRFLKADISAPHMGLEETFDIVNVFDVLYHIVDDGAFETAIQNIGARCRRGGWTFITDAFDPQKSVGEHVRYRGLETYKAALDKALIDIIDVVGLFRMMGRPLRPAVRNGLTRRTLGMAVESLAWFIYILDMAYCPTTGSLMRLAVCRKR
jgi:SAM-dependent methyltransferase